MIDKSHEKQIFSQNGEDGVIHHILKKIDLHNRYCVEFGTGDGKVCCTRALVAKGWKYLWLNRKGCKREWGVVRRAWVNAENIESLFREHVVPFYFDVMSVDINGNDYWVWKAIRRYRPRIVVIEYNSCVPNGISATVPYDPEFRWNHSSHFGASLQALYELGLEKQYTLVYCEQRGINAFFVSNEALPDGYEPTPVDQLYVPTQSRWRADPVLRMIHPVTGEPVWPSDTPSCST